MPQMEGLYPILAKSGVKRDGTSFESEYYSDALWCRFQRGRPRKIGGYNLITNTFSAKIYGSYADSRNGYNYIFGGSASMLEAIVVDNTGGAGGVYTRTPAGFSSSPNNVWQFDGIYDSGGSLKRVVAHAGQNLTAIDSTVQTPVYYGTSDATAALTSTGTSVSGGVFCTGPYMVGLDNDGYVLWSPPNTMAFTGAGSGSARIAPNKLIKGVRTRGGSGASPSGLIFSLDELYRMYFIGGAPIFAFDYIGDTTLISTSAVVENNGRHYWPDISGFKTFAGVIEDLPNDMNVNYFYDNYNKAQRQKIWGLKVPRYNEIWWFWPKGNATECTDVLIYNIKENTWYDTAWSGGQSARSSGIYSKFFSYPYMFGLDANSSGKYSLWQHEFGVDRQEGSNYYAIRSYFETADMSYNQAIVGNDFTGLDRWVQCMRIEPDFVQAGQMSFVVRGKKYAASTNVTESTPFYFNPDTEKVDLKEQRRQMTIRFESNVAGGDYQLGETMGSFKVGDGRQ